jgi:DNA-binding response OmpR family regulator
MVRVLIVDDEEVARLTLAEILRLEGYEICAVESGEAAVGMLQVESYDVMVLDLKMPGIGGMEVLKKVVDTLPNLAVIVLTAYGSMDSAIQAIRYRVHDYILKPADPEQVLRSIARALADKSLGSPPAPVEQASGRLKLEVLPGGAALSWDKRQISWQNGSLSLTPTEARLLKALFERKNEMIPHAELVFLIQGYQIDTEEAAKILRPVVSRLRQKMEDVPGWGDWIKNVRGAGYVLEMM